MTDHDEKAGEPIDLVLQVSTCWSDGKHLLEYYLRSPSGAVHLPRERFRSKAIGQPDEFRRDLLAELENLRQGLDVEDTALVGPEALATLTSLGQWLYQRLFPEPMREAFRLFRDQVTTLLIVSDEPWIPWEIVRPFEDQGDDFFCMQFEMSRWLAGAPAPVVAKGIQRLTCVTADQTEGQIALPDAGKESRILAKLAADHPGVTPRFLEDPSHEEMVQCLKDGVDLLHFAGHSQDGDVDGEEGERRPEMAKIELADHPFRARDLTGPLAARLRKERPVVFFNSCEAGRLGSALTGLGGWAQSWVEDCGASAFLAPFLSVNDTTAHQFAEVFYRELQAGRTLGNALRATRRELRNNLDLTWLTYSLYGHPNARVVLGEDVLEIEEGVGESPLKLPEHRWRPDRSPPGALLRAEFGVVPFHFRDDEMENFEQWCQDPAPIGIRLYTGAGGMGKTRLALRLCQKLRDDGWQAGVVDSSQEPAQLWQELEEAGGPCLLVVDYAETRRDLLVPLFREISRVEQGPVRVLLLARAALDWWEQLKREGDGVGDLLQGPATRHFSLQALAFSSDQRASSYRIAAQAFSARLGQEMPASIPEDFDEDHFERALLLHMAALAAVDGVDVKGEDGILDYVLAREHRFWARIAAERELPTGIADGIGRAMAAITLGGGVVGEGQAMAVLRGLRFFSDKDQETLLRVVWLLRECYPGDSPEQWIEPVMPDLLGEHLFDTELEKGANELFDLVLGKETASPGDSSPGPARGG